LAKSSLKLEELERELKKGTLRPVYLLAGEEPLLRDDALAIIRSTVLEGAPVDFNLDRLSGQGATPASLQDSVRSLPVMAARRLVILDEPEGRRAGAKLLVECLADLVKELCRLPAEEQQTVLVVTAAKADRRARWVKAIAEPAALVECDPPKAGRSVTAFLKREAKQQSIDLAAGAAELLAERVGPQLLMLRHELAKASLLAGLGEAVTRDHVEQSVSSVAEQPIWDLTDAIGAGRGADAISMLARLLHSGAAPPAILGTLAGHFRKLSRVRGGGAVGGPPFIVRKLESQASRFSPARLRGCMRAIHETDTALKGAGSLPPVLAIERLVIALAG